MLAASCAVREWSGRGQDDGTAERRNLLPVGSARARAVNRSAEERRHLVVTHASPFSPQAPRAYKQPPARCWRCVPTSAIQLSYSDFDPSGRLHPVEAYPRAASSRPRNSTLSQCLPPQLLVLLVLLQLPTVALRDRAALPSARPTTMPAPSQAAPAGSSRHLRRPTTLAASVRLSHTSHRP